ncbi:hypothetical protein [Streptomyces sp. 4F14]|uniref:DUF7144 family membrane protein n=1 Tax=Streptomyces sp. 4F14 TaxID=3394380 RepID=UPI003A83C7A9
MTTAPTSPRPNGWAVGGTLFAGVLLFVQGFLGVFEGIAAIAEDDVYARVGDYAFKFSLTAWGWIHLVLGLVLLAVGWGVLGGKLWARATAIVLAGLSIVVNFLYLPYQPWWAVIGIALGLFVVWSLAHDDTPRTG